MSWQLATSVEFDKAVRKLDRAVVKRVRTYLEEMVALEDPRSRGRALSADKAGYWRYRIGDYRVIAQIRDSELLIIAIGLGHRSEIYSE